MFWDQIDKSRIDESPNPDLKKSRIERKINVESLFSTNKIQLKFAKK